MTTASLYLRISHDPSGRELGVERQESECRAFCAQRGWEVGEVFRDNDLSATSGVVRPAFERLLRSNPEVVVCWHSDRIVRLSKELERVIDLGVNIHAVNAGHLDLSTPAGRANARSMTAWAQYEGEQKGLRQRSANKQRAEEGKPSWASRPPLGYTKKAKVRPREAAAIRQAYLDLLEGRTLYAIALQWNTEGPASRLGGRWTGANLRRLLMHPRNAGIATYNGVEVGPGAWEPLIELETFRAVETMLKGENRWTATNTRNGGRKSSSLLAGIAVCGGCGAKMRTQRHNKSDRPDAYKCGNRGDVYAPMEAADSLAILHIIEALSLEQVQRYWRQRGGEETERTALLAQAATLRGRLDEAAQAFASGALLIAQLTTITATLSRELETAEKQLAEWRPAYQASALLADPENLWLHIEELGLEDQRQLVGEVLKEVTLLPRPTTRTRFGPQWLKVKVRGE